MQPSSARRVPPALLAVSVFIWLIACFAGWSGAQRLGPERGVVPPPSNEQVGIDIDRFIGNPFQSSALLAHAAIVKRPILKHGDPHVSGDPGAVLEYRKELAVATLLGRNRTPLVEIPEQQFLYVESGKGRLDNGHDYWALREGIAVLIHPRARHRIINTCAEPLEMLMLTWDNPNVSRKALVVRDVHVLPTDGRYHWCYMGKNIFTPSDGLHANELIAIDYVPPMSIAEPHAHPPHWEEIWIKLPPYDSFLMLGSEVREMPPNTAFLVPPNGQTVHSVVNLTRNKTQAWVYIGHWTIKQPTYPKLASIAPRPLKPEKDLE